MSDRFRPISMPQLAAWAFTELERRDSLFNIPRRAFFVPRPDHRYRLRQHGLALETPVGVAAGPHTQLAQNTVAAWLCGARVIELKTVQTLDEIEVHKPCIDVEDEGYNVEWSQELRIRQSFDEYLRAWVLIHALHRRLGFPGDRPGVLFNMSVGYDYAGIRQPNVQWYLDAMADASEWLPAYVDVVAGFEPAVRDIDIPARLSDTVTLSTMHGCPPGEIERISRYLLEERRLHTSVKCNPTLLGAERVRGIVNDDLAYADVHVPDEAFGHDLAWTDAVPMFRRLADVAAAEGLGFGLKLSNTLEVENTRTVFDRDPTMYLSGRALHPVTVNLAAAIADALPDVPLSFAGGVDAFNVADVLASGVATVTVASDLLKTGGYLRLLQYPERLDEAFDEACARDIEDFVLRTARATGFSGDGVAAAATHNLRRYAAAVRTDPRYRKDSLRTDRTKTLRPLTPFDCIAPPCVETCPIDQQVPQYMAAVARGNFAEAARIVRGDNPLAAILGRVCDHLCEGTCVRTHLDEPLAIRQIKRFIVDAEADGAGDAAGEAAAGAAGAARSGGDVVPPVRPARPRVAVVGAGPAGLAAAEALLRAGVTVTIFEARPFPGGMPGGAIPSYRLPQTEIDRDLARLERLGVEIRYSMRAGTDFTIDGLRAAGFEAVFVAVGAQVGRTLGLAGEDAEGVVDGVAFLRAVREGRQAALHGRVGVVGAGDTAMDCARSALRAGADLVSLIYRRTIDQMPADREEIRACLDEGVRIVDRAKPVSLHVEDGQLAGVMCLRTEYRSERDASGRKVPFDVPGSEFELPLDGLILAVSQRAELDCFGDAVPALTRDGYVAIDPETLETSIAGVYAGGDISGHGPASIVRAAADGHRAARAILAALGVDPAPAPASAPAGTGPVDLQVAALRRARRQYRVAIDAGRGYTRDEAMAEASRCLRCDEVCSLCVGVCPNLALLTYEVTPRRVALPAPVPASAPVGERLPTTDGTSFAVDQRYQVAVLADLCNECGTCVTACPTAGAPYRDKPRLYLDRSEFEAQDRNAFLLLPGAAMAGRFGGETHRIEIDGCIRYEGPAIRATLDAATFEVLEATSAGEGGAAAASLEPAAASLEPATAMASLLTGLLASAPHLAGMADRPRPPLADRA